MTPYVKVVEPQTKRSKLWDKFVFYCGPWLLLALMLAAIGGAFWAKWALYFHRHPDAAWWSFFLQ